MSFKKPIFVGLSVLLGACSFAPDYAPPAMPQPTPETYGELGDWIKAQPADEAPRGPWWAMFKDPQLDALEVKVTEANQSLKSAVARYEEARAVSSAADADLFPTITGSGDATRNRLSSKAANNPSVKTFNDFTLGASTSYEIDFWGRIRNAVAAADSEAEATKADLAYADLSLHAELASDYFSLRGDDALITVLTKTVDVDTKAVNVLHDRLNGGIATEADLANAETQMQMAKATLSDTLLHRAKLEHAIAVLAGQNPSSFHLDPMPLGNIAPPRIEPGLPSKLLERRPDIAAAERRTMEANAEIGVARAAWFPAISLTGSIGFESAAAGNIFTAPATFWSLGPAAALTLFDAGRINALSEEAHAAFDEAAADYRQTVLAGYREVEDNLAGLHHLADETKSQDGARDAAERFLKQENNLYLGGAISYVDVGVAQYTSLTAEVAAVNVRVRYLTAGVNLVKALGGGWTTADLKRLEPTPAPVEAPLPADMVPQD